MRDLAAKLKLTYVLVAVNVLLYLAMVMFTFAVAGVFSPFYIDSSVLRYFGAEYVPDILQGELWRLVLPAFLHGGIMHLLLNMYALIVVGEHIENFYGKRKLLAVYVLAAVAGSLLSIGVALFTRINSGLPQADFPVSIGASGAIFGLIGLLLGHTYKRDDYNPKIPVNVGGLWFFVLINLMFGFGINVAPGGWSVNNAAHIGGLLGGFLLGLLFSTKNSFYTGKLYKILEHILIALSILLVVVSIIAHIFFFLLI